LIKAQSRQCDWVSYCGRAKQKSLFCVRFKAFLAEKSRGYWSFKVFSALCRYTWGLVRMCTS
jgi:hypothetical protein